MGYELEVDIGSVSTEMAVIDEDSRAFDFTPSN